ncbi:MAG: DNA polymerase III subunit gamma/tau [Patescibacteria group bacterium]|nr:DNA polymerase III subunit gamma/tau [Patescibacteria group bacterium]
MVFYRKYRPQKIEDLDSEKIRERLYSVLAGHEIPHAFLFTGPKGLGKTSAARILAKAVNCENRSKVKSQKSKAQVKSKKLKDEETEQIQSYEGIEPCNKCSQCISITNGTNLDVLEIDGASNRGIDEIRDIKEKINLSAQTLTSKKIYIIDEVHMLTQEAFNALLKTLEEPPPHVIFILCTTEPAKIPETIGSRCFQIAFRKAAREELMRSFKRIAEGEKIDIDNEGLSFLADLAEGGFRDGAKILEEVVQASGKKKITKEILEEKYHLADSKIFARRLIKSMHDQNAEDSLRIILEIADRGFDIKRFVSDILNILHVSLLVQSGVPAEGEDLKLELSEISEMAGLFINAYSEVRYAVLPQLPLEIAVLKYARPKSLSAHPSLPAGRLDGSKADSNISLPGVSSGRSNSEQGLLKELIEKAKSYNHSLSALLRGCAILSFDDDKLVLETKFKFHRERLMEKKNYEFLQKTCEEVSGKKVKILIELKEK